MAIQINMRVQRQLKILCRALYLPLCCLALVLLIQMLRWLQHKQETRISGEDDTIPEVKKILYPLQSYLCAFVGIHFYGGD